MESKRMTLRCATAPLLIGQAFNQSLIWTFWTERCRKESFIHLDNHVSILIVWFEMNVCWQVTVTGFFARENLWKRKYFQLHRKQRHLPGAQPDFNIRPPLPGGFGGNSKKYKSFQRYCDQLHIEWPSLYNVPLRCFDDESKRYWSKHLVWRWLIFRREQF